MLAEWALVVEQATKVIIKLTEENVQLLARAELAERSNGVNCSLFGSAQRDLEEAEKLIAWHTAEDAFLRDKIQKMQELLDACAGNFDAMVEERNQKDVERERADKAEAELAQFQNLAERLELGCIETSEDLRVATALLRRWLVGVPKAQHALQKGFSTVITDTVDYLRARGIEP